MISPYVTWAELDLDALASNVKAFQKFIGPQVKLIGVVKANAYGHGASVIGKAMQQAGADMLAVHRLSEGEQLRAAGIKGPICIMGYTPIEGVDLVLANDLTPSLTTVEFAQALSGRASSLGLRVPVHIKVDTGMSRYGLFPEEVLPFLRAVQHLDGILLEGLFTHLATADEKDTSHTLQQLEVFEQVLADVNLAGFHFPCIHAANSAATLRFPHAHYNAVRPGISLYGLRPSAEFSLPFDLKSVLSLKSRVCRVRCLPVGAGVSYGRTYVTDRPTLAALVPVGYGDGYHRILSNRARVLIRGKTAPIIGRVCMDQFVVDASAIPDVQLGDEVVLIGAQGEDRITADELAEQAGTINYEVLTALLPRIARVYIRSGQIQEVIK